MSGHTPGPWAVQRYLVNDRDEEVSSLARGSLRARLRIVADEAPMIIADMVAGSSAEAALLAAAPDLLSLAREYRALHIASLVFGKDCSCTACARADEIIARAEGK